MRRHLLSESQNVINPLMDAGKLRILAGKNKRHSIKRLIRPSGLDPQALLYGHEAKQAKLRKSVSDYFFVYTRQVIPKMEEKIELQLLEKFKDRIGNVQERKEVIQAYQNRKDNLAKLAEPDDIGQPERPQEQFKIPISDAGRQLINIEGEGLRFHTFEDIGKYTVFPKTHWQRMFPSQFFGNYYMDEFKRNKTFGIMTREEGLKLTNDLARLSLPHERKIDYFSILTQENSDVKHDVIQDEQMFTAIQQDFSLDLLDYINSQPADHKLSLKKLFASPAVFDALVTILVQELRKKPMRYHLCVKEARAHVIDQFVRVLHQTMIDKKLNPQTLYEIFTFIRTINITLPKKNLGQFHELQANEEHIYKFYTNAYHKICNHLWRPEDVRRVSLDGFKGVNSGCLLWGPRGVGKSQILSYAAAWAHENQWMVVTVPRCEMFTDGTEEIYRYQNGLYLQNELAQKYLYDFRTSNEMLLRNTDVDMSLYGKIDISGVKDGDPEPNPRLWDEERQCYTDSWKENLYDFEVKVLGQEYEEMQYRCADKLPDPKKLIEIADLGISSPDLATNCFGEILEQIYHTDKFMTLFAMDGYNDWFKPSQYYSFRYDNSSTLKGRIPPQDFALVRMLMKFDGHMVRNGFKLTSTTHYRQFNHLCTPEMLHLPNGYHSKVGNLALNDFRNMLRYYHFSKWMGDYHKEPEVESYYMETQGNWWAFHQSFNRYQRLDY